MSASGTIVNLSYETLANIECELTLYNNSDRFPLTLYGAGTYIAHSGAIWEVNRARKYGFQLLWENPTTAPTSCKVTYFVDNVATALNTAIEIKVFKKPN